MEDKDKKFKPFNCWPNRDCPGWPLKGYVQPADCDEIRIAGGECNSLHKEFKESALQYYYQMQDMLKEMYPGWEPDGCDLEGIFLWKEIPGDPRAQGDGDDMVAVNYTCGMVGLHFAVMCDSGKVIVDDDDSLGDELRIMAIEDYLMFKFQSERLKFEWNDDEENVTVRTPNGGNLTYLVHKDIYGNPTLIAEITKEVFPIKIV